MDSEKMFLALVRSTLAIRKESDKQWKLAQRMGMDTTLLSRYLRGRQEMPEAVKSKIIVELGLDRMLTGVEANKKEAKHRKSAAGGR